MINFNFTLSDEEADTFSDIIHQAVLRAQEQSLFAENDAERNWWKDHSSYLKNISDRILAGNKKVR
jgi:hypothetical protein